METRSPDNQENTEPCNFVHTLLQKVLTLFAKLILLFFQIIPERASIAIGKGLGLFWYTFIRYRRALVIDNLTQAFKDEKSHEEILAIARKNFMHYGLCLAESLRAPLLTKETFRDKIIITGLEHVENALKQGKGAILFCGHYGNCDMMAIGQAMEGVNAHIITKTVKNKVIDAVWTDIRKSKGVSLLPNKKTGFSILKLLKKNEAVVLIFDQHRPGTMGIRVNFFGRPARTMRAVATLALKTGCAVIPANNWRDENNIHHAEAGEAIPLIRKESEEETIRENTQRYNDILESYIRQHPEQWLWIHRRWKEAIDQN